jgi:short-subunit dehydrogenase
MSLCERYGPWAVVAGASDGTGAEFCRRLAADGVNLVMIARRPEPLEQLAQEIRTQTGRECVTASVDLSAADAAEQALAAIGGREVGLLVMNAGSDPNGSRFLDAPLDAWMELVQRNAITTMKLCHHLARPMRERRRGGLLLVNSAAGYRGSSFMTVYSASKGFVLNLAEGLWAELHKFGVDVLSFHLIMTDTPFYRRLLERKNLPLPPGTVPADVVVARALAMLPHGPVSNIGQENDEAGYALVSPDTLREVILRTDESSKASFGGD